MFGNRQLQVLERIQPGFELGYDGLLVLAHRIDGEAVGVEQIANVGGHLKHDLVDVGSGMNLVGDVLQVLGEQEPCIDVDRPSRRGWWGIEYRAHNGLAYLNRAVRAMTAVLPCILYDEKTLPAALKFASARH